MTDVGTMRARYRRILRFAARYLAQTWWFELVPAARSASRGSPLAAGRRGLRASRSASTRWRSTSAAS